LKYVTSSGATAPPILKHFISLANREPGGAKVENRKHLKCRSISHRGGVSRGQGEGTKVKATKISGGGGDASPSYNPPMDCHTYSYI